MKTVDQPTQGRRRSTRRVLAVVWALALVGTACGSRNEEAQNAAPSEPVEEAAPAAEGAEEEFGAAPATESADSATAGTGAPNATDGAAETPAAPTSGEGSATAAPAKTAAKAKTGASAPTSPASGASRPAKASAQNNGGGSGGNDASGAAGKPSEAKSPADPAPGTPAPAPTPTAPGTPDPGALPPGAPIVLGAVGQGTGPLGALFVPIIGAAKAWQADVNARGGINGHPVKIIFADDGGDPSRAQTIVRNFVENDKILAVAFEHGPVTVASVMPYLEKVGVPRIGTVEGHPVVDTSPMSFQATISVKATGRGHIMPLWALRPDAKKVHVVYCREVQACSNMKDDLVANAKRFGLTVTGESQASLAQPDYTAEILAAKNGGADAIAAVLENASVIRLARGVQRQGGGLSISFQQTMHTDSFYKNGGEAIEGVLGSSSTVAYDTSEKLADYRAAMDRYQPGVEQGVYGSSTWVYGKIIETAIGKLGNNITSAGLVEALHSFRNETFGGLLPPITFPQGRSHERVNECLVVGEVKGGKFVPKDNDPDQFTCDPQWKPETP